MTDAAKTELVTVPTDNALQVFSSPNGLDPYLEPVRSAIAEFVGDISTKKGRDEIASFAHKITRSKTALDAVGKELVADLKELPKKIDAERKRVRDLLDQWRDEVRLPLTEWEEAEKSRTGAHEANLAELGRMTDAAYTPGIHSSDLRAMLERLHAMPAAEAWEEYQKDASVAMERADARLTEALERAEKSEAEAAELERLRKEQAERDKRDHEERIKKEAAEQAAQAERDAAARREAEAKAAEERAKREAQEAQQRAERAEREAEQRAKDAAEAERRRIEQQQAEADRQAKAREADLAHRKAVNNAALQAMTAEGVPEETAKTVIRLIATGKVPSIVIKY